MGPRLEIGKPADPPLALYFGLGGAFFGSNYMPSCLEIVKCAFRLSWLFFRWLAGLFLGQEKISRGLPQPYWRQGRKEAPTRGPWWIKFLVPLAFLPAIHGAPPLTTMFSSRPAFRVECRERVGLRHGWQENENRQTRPKRAMSSESILAVFAG